VIDILCRADHRHGCGGRDLVAVAGIGAAAVLEPIRGSRHRVQLLGYGHGKQMATPVLYIGITLWCWPGSGWPRVLAGRWTAGAC